MGVANAAAQYLWTKALHAAPATAVSPFYYFLLVWSLVLGFFVWGDIPTVSLLAGSGIVVASGLFLLFHEAQRETATPAVETGEATATRSA
jgi:drug/metabolite transporter (DMT)-like permease